MSKKIFGSILILGFVLLVIVYIVRVSNDKGNIKDDSLAENPKLVVGIVVDQMKYQYLTKFWNHYSNKGFKQLINKGFIAKNNHYGYAQTSTGPGHTTVATGTYPSVHGIIGNSWYDKNFKKSIYCVEDNRYKTIGATGNGGKKSPRWLLTSTLSDENRIATNFKGKTIGIAIKDRGAILSSGHTANAAYWYEGGEEGKFITSTYYLDSMPKWVDDFNDSRLIDNYLVDWETYYDISIYNESGSDDNEYETPFNGEERPIFPHKIKDIATNNSSGKISYSTLASTPFGNSLVADFAIKAIKGEQLGVDNFTDFLMIDFSSTDYVGHRFGANSKEIQDTYIRLDKEIERLLMYLDKEIGKREYTVFLTADHGATDAPGFLKENKIPINYFNIKNWKEFLESSIKKMFGTKKIIEGYSNEQLFLNHELINKLKLDLSVVKKKLIDKMQDYPGIDNVYSSENIFNYNEDHYLRLLRNGYNKNLSGDIVYTLMPNWVYPRKGSTHGTRFNHDTHVPLIFYGKGIKRGVTNRKTDVIDIAPTIASLLGISSPSGSTGDVIYEVLD